MDVKKPYIQAVCAFADMDLIAKTKFKFAVDAMYGSGRGVLSGIFAERGVQYVAIRQELNPLFPGNQSRTDRAAHGHAAGDCGSRKM